MGLTKGADPQLIDEPVKITVEPDTTGFNVTITRSGKGDLVTGSAERGWNDMLDNL